MYIEFTLRTRKAKEPTHAQSTKPFKTNKHNLIGRENKKSEKKKIHVYNQQQEKNSNTGLTRPFFFLSVVVVVAVKISTTLKQNILIVTFIHTCKCERNISRVNKGAGKKKNQNQNQKKKKGGGIKR